MSDTQTIDPALKDYATESQARYIEAVLKSGSMRGAARELGVNYKTIRVAIDGARRRASLQGYAPAFDMKRPAPPGFFVKGASTYYDKDGKPAGQWVKTSRDGQQAEVIMREALVALQQDIPRLPALPRALAPTFESLCNVYTLTDSHVGMLAWHKEGGEDWDLRIAEQTLVGCFEHLIAQSPPASTCVVAQLGDFLHSDGLMPVTPTSGHILDQDGRFAKVVQAAIRILRRVVDMALLRHQKVIVLMAEGNHDMASSVWLRALFQALYEAEPRVQVIDSELPYYTHQHGQVMLCWHHGHLKKNDQLPLLFAAQFPRMWGETVKRYCHTGHRHHHEEKEHSGMTVVQHPTLAARDAYSARGGWISERNITAVTYHAVHGDVARTTVTPQMLDAPGPAERLH